MHGRMGDESCRGFGPAGKKGRGRLAFSTDNQINTGKFLIKNPPISCESVMFSCLITAIIKSIRRCHASYTGIT